MPEPTTALAPFVAATISSEQYALVKRTIAPPDATEDEVALFLYDCERCGVHPLDRRLIFTKRDGKYTPIATIDLFRSRAAETGEHAGTDLAAYTGIPGEDGFSAAVTVWRFVKGERCAFAGRAVWQEFYPGDKQGFMWRRMPENQVAKCAEAQALRKAFPERLSGFYIREEMEQDRRTIDADTIPPKQLPTVNRDARPITDGMRRMLSTLAKNAKLTRDEYNSTIARVCDGKADSSALTYADVDALKAELIKLADERSAEEKTTTAF